MDGLSAPYSINHGGPRPETSFEGAQAHGMAAPATVDGISGLSNEVRTVAFIKIYILPK